MSMLQKSEPRNVLFICTHNSARSQMAEAFLNNLYPDQFRAFSAGTEPGTLNQNVVVVMSQVGIDISKNVPSNVNEFLDRQMDIVVTVCDGAKEACPVFPSSSVIHRSFTDPSSFHGSKNDVLEQTRGVRDEILEWVKEYFRPEA